ncbi:MAG TPA: hypothetical protein DCE44_09565, partial [Verrucomicrobiales bacterium]|nr:hypothetical protein [Verrucomicrobiales bacterium]
MKSVPILITLFLGVSAARGATPAADANWPAWRGPLGNGTSPTADPPIHWSESKGIKWKVTVPGRGTSTPVIWANQLFLLTSIPAGSTASPKSGEPSPGAGGRPAPEQPTQAQRFTVLSFDRASGNTVWERSPRSQVPHEGHHRDHGFASASPVTDGEVLIASFGSFGIYGYDLKGTLLWEKDLGDMRTRNGFGEGSSPALYGQTVVILWDHEGEDFIVALDKRDGKELWRRQRDEPTGWSTPLIVQSDGKP